MTLPLTPAPRLSDAARPKAPLVVPPLPELGPDLHEAARQLGNGAQGEADIRERELLGMAMASPAGLESLWFLEPGEFSVPANEQVARAVQDLSALDLPHDAAAVTAEMRRRSRVPHGEPGSMGQLLPHLDPEVPLRRVDAREYGLGAWETMSLAPAEKAPALVQQVRALSRQRAAITAVTQAMAGYEHGVDMEMLGHPESDGLGVVTKRLADQLVSIPKALTPRPMMTRPGPHDLRLPPPPVLSAHGREALRHR